MWLNYAVIQFQVYSQQSDVLPSVKKSRHIFEAGVRLRRAHAVHGMAKNWSSKIDRVIQILFYSVLRKLNEFVSNKWSNWPGDVHLL